MAKRRSQKFLVTDQPGMRILVSGLILSFFLGYVVKSLLSPTRVATQISKAANQINKNVSVKFGSAYFSFSDGILPRLAVVISNVRMESDQVCWASPVLEVNELRLPLSLFNIFRGKSVIRQIEADTARITLREKFEKCSESVEDNAESKPLVSLSPSEQAKKYRDDVSSIYVQNLSVVAEKYSRLSSNFMGFSIKVKSFEPKIIEITAKTHLLKDAQVGDYLSYANLFMQYKESPQPSIQTHFFGNWREGHYSLIGSYILDEHVLSIETDLKHIPLSQVLDLLHKYNLASASYNPRQIWISTKAQLKGPVENILNSHLEIKDVFLEGELGELAVNNISVSSLKPFTYSPILIDVKRLDVAKLMQFFNLRKNTNVLSNLGEFSGKVEIESDKKIRMFGEHKGLEFVFSNKGQQALQILDKIEGDANFDSDQWKFVIKRIEPHGGSFTGQVNVKADKNFKNVNLKANVEELILDHEVQKLMTSEGNIGHLEFDTEARLKDGELDFLKALVQIEDMDVEGMKFSKSKMVVDWKNQEFLINTNIKSLKVERMSPGADILQQVTRKSWWNKDSLTMNNLSGTFRAKNLKYLLWKNFQGSVGKSGRLLTDGSWDDEGNLRGLVTNRDLKLQKKWIIEGTRKEPVFVEDFGSIRSLNR